MTKDNLFEDILKELKDIHKLFPDMRFGLVIQNAIDQEKKLSNVDLTDRSSKQLLDALKKYNTKHKIKRGK